MHVTIRRQQVLHRPRPKTWAGEGQTGAPLLSDTRSHQSIPQHHSTQQVSKQLNLMNFINGPLPNKALGWWLLLRKVPRTSHSSNGNNTKSSFSTTLSPVKVKLYLKFGNSIDPRYQLGLQHLTSTAATYYSHPQSSEEPLPTSQ